MDKLANIEILKERINRALITIKDKKELRNMMNVANYACLHLRTFLQLKGDENDKR